MNMKYLSMVNVVLCSACAIMYGCSGDAGQAIAWTCAACGWIASVISVRRARMMEHRLRRGTVTVPRAMWELKGSTAAEAAKCES